MYHLVVSILQLEGRVSKAERRWVTDARKLIKTDGNHRTRQGRWGNNEKPFLNYPGGGISVYSFHLIKIALES